MSHPGSHHNVLESVEYLRNTLNGHDKFYRAAVVQVEDEWYAVYNWGRGAIDRDPEWYVGQIKYEWHHSLDAAIDAAFAKVREKQHGGYDRQPTMIGDHYPEQRGALPNRVYAGAQGYAPKPRPTPGGVVQPPRKPKAPAPISITTTDGQLKPALANRTKWRAQE